MRREVGGWHSCATYRPPAWRERGGRRQLEPRWCAISGRHVCGIVGLSRGAVDCVTARYRAAIRLTAWGGRVRLEGQAVGQRSGVGQAGTRKWIIL